MAEGDCTVYQSFIVAILSKKIDCTGDAFWITLHTGSSINQAHEGRADVIGTEYGTAAGYTAGGKQCTTPAVTKAAAVKFDAVDPAAWTSLGPLTPATPAHAFLWDETATSPTDALVCAFVLGTTATNGGNYTLSFATAGILTITA
jgi:hypothetical protein